VRTHGAWVAACERDRSQRTRGAWAATCVLADYAHTWCLGSRLCAGHTLAHMWRLGCSERESCPYPLKNTWRLGHGAGPKRNGSGIRTQDQWVLRNDPILLGSSSKLMVLGPKILNIIMCFRNIIIFIIINIINKIINKFERKYYY
jgi:hypothetical protein